MELAVFDTDSDAWRLAVALGIGLLLGLERERRKGTDPSRAPAGIRTFALVSLLGGISMLIGGVAVLAVGMSFVALAAIVAYVFSDRSDPGLTTEVALPVTFLLGALAIENPALAGGLAVAVGILLASREYLQRFVAEVLTEQELHDGLLFGAAALVVLPLVPDRALGPYDAFNPFTIWRLVVLVMLISAAGYIALRLMGPKLGLPLAGFASGFVSSSAAVGAMGARAKKDPSMLRPAVSAAVLSTVATVVQMVIVVGATDRGALREIQVPMVFAGVAAVAYGALFAFRSLRTDGERELSPGRAFDPKNAVLFAGTVGIILFVSALLNETLGDSGAVLSGALAGFADTHAAAISVASLVASGRIDAEDAVVPILAGFTTNSLTKAVLARVAGSRRYALEIWPGLLLVAAAAWAGYAISAV
jgi:uncharacterized membrane protein (DUF4010 family)